MGHREILRGCITLLIGIVLLSNLGIGSVLGQGTASGPCTIVGRVYNSDGENPGIGFEGTYAAVIISHVGERRTYQDPNGLELDDQGEYWYSVTIPEGGWAVGDVFQVEVDGRGWGDRDDFCNDHIDIDVTNWVIDSSVIRQDVDTIDDTIIADDILTSSFLLFIIIIFVFIILLYVIFMKSIHTVGPTIPSQHNFVQQPSLCPTCGGIMEYVNRYQKWYCSICERYTSWTNKP